MDDHLDQKFFDLDEPVTIYEPYPDSLKLKGYGTVCAIFELTDRDLIDAMFSQFMDHLKIGSGVNLIYAVKSKDMDYCFALPEQLKHDRMRCKTCLIKLQVHGNA